ncbi:MAG: hypothetical protein ACERKV_03645 [Clostridiaceae bacterium]
MLQRITYQYNFNNNITVQPGVNPFKGGYYGKDMYTLLVEKNNKSRDYGVSSVMSNIKGDVKITGELPVGENVNLYNLKVNGDLMINIGEGDINMFGGEYNKYIVYESGISDISNSELGK